MTAVANSRPSSRSVPPPSPNIQFLRLATEVDLARLGVHAEALLWIYRFLSDTVGVLDHVSAIDVAPILTGVKRTGLVRPSGL